MVRSRDTSNPALDLFPVGGAGPTVPAAANDGGSTAPVGSVAAILSGLNDEQRAAVTHGEGPLLIVAGAGTGKTQVLTRRIAWLVATKRARP